MTERFTRKEYAIYEKGNPICMTLRDVDKRLNELWEENEQLKKDKQRLIKMMDNVANYMQKQHKDIPLDDFVEWWNNIATEGLDD